MFIAEPSKVENGAKTNAINLGSGRVRANYVQFGSQPAVLDGQKFADCLKLGQQGLKSL